jgi:hypothetical protein
MRNGNMAQAIKPGPSYPTGTYLMNRSETGMIPGFWQSQGNCYSGIGIAEICEKWWAQKDLNLRPADYESDALTN